VEILASRVVVYFAKLLTFFLFFSEGRPIAAAGDGMKEPGLTGDTVS